MVVGGKNIDDECALCENFLKCNLMRQGHGVSQKRNNVSKMVVCQLRHREKREGKNGVGRANIENGLFRRV